VKRALVVATVAVIAWSIAFATWQSSPASYDFVALYASARLVATGHAADVTDRNSILAMETETRPERTRFLNNPNPPVVSLLLAPLGLLSFDAAYATMLAVLVAALVAAAFLLAPLAAADQRGRLFPFAMLAPPSLIALVQGQTTPLILLAVAASLRVSPRWSGLLLATTAMRPQFFPLFALVAVLDRERRWPFLAGVAAVVAVSFAVVGFAGIPGYIDLVTYSAAELRPVDMGVASLLRRFGAGEDALLSLLLSAVAMLAGAIMIVRERLAGRTVSASAWSLFAAPHALPHDAILCYPAVASRAQSTRATAWWVGTGMAVAVVHQAGLPIASIWLLALATWTREKRPRVMGRVGGIATESGGDPALSEPGRSGESGEANSGARPPEPRQDPRPRR
jgi:glycosyl transferase family 87